MHRQRLRAGLLWGVTLLWACIAVGQTPDQGQGAGDQSPEDTPLIAVSADVIELSNQMNRNLGFAWTQNLNYLEDLPSGGLIRIGDFSRKTALATTINLLETEGKAQSLMNPKVVLRSGEEAQFGTGTSIPIPVCTLQGCSVQQQEAQTSLQVRAQVIDEKKGTLEVLIKLQISNFGSQSTVINGASYPSVDKRGIETVVNMKSGETLVIGGFKSTTKNVSIQRVPFLGRIPLLGALFTSKSIVESDHSLFMFITLEIVK